MFSQEDSLKACITISSLTTIVLTACPSERAPTPHIVLDSEWQTRPPLGYVADTTGSGNIAPGASLEFKQLKISILATTVDSTGGTPHAVARMRLEEGGATEEITAPEGVSHNWHGYHVAIVAVHGRGELGGGLVALEVATVASLPQCIGKTWKDRPAPWPCT
jgi:hypothetical protein